MKWPLARQIRDLGLKGLGSWTLRDRHQGLHGICFFHGARVQGFRV